MTAPNLKLLVASTPKTGNTWLKYLLSAIYDLPIVRLPEVFNGAYMDGLGDGWVAHQHYRPKPELTDWARERGATVLTTVRHPGDVLISFFHFVSKNSELFSTRGRVASTIALDGPEIGAHTVQYVETTFMRDLQVSLDWMHSGQSLIVRYEDLWRDPLNVLTTLTSQIYPTTPDCIERAIERCELGLMRDLYDPKRTFFRTGQVGSWHRELPPEIVDRFQADPYPALFQELGYSLEPVDPTVQVSAQPYTSKNPLRAVRAFDNGVPIVPMLVRLYLSVEHCFKRWPCPQETHSPDSFFAWLIAPAEADPFKGSAPLITNLAAQLYLADYEIRKKLPDLFGRDRLTFAYWYVAYAKDEYHIPDAFTDPILRSSDSFCYLASKLDALADRTAYIEQMEREWQATQNYIRKLERTHPLIWLKRAYLRLRS